MKEKGAHHDAFFALRKEGLICMNKSDESLINPVAMQATASFIGTEKHPLSGPIPVVTEELRFHSQRIRVVTIDGAAQFVAMDVAAILEYANARQAVYMHVSRCNRGAVCLTDAIGRTQRLTTINEAGLFELILRSEKPAAREFKGWVTGEVLPSIRATGQYTLETAKVPLLAEISKTLRGRGAARARQINRVIAHRKGTFSVRIGKRWLRHIPTLEVCDLPKSHALREGWALGAFQSGQTTGLIQ
jgi:prophage antirepressor-like protein